MMKKTKSLRMRTIGFLTALVLMIGLIPLSPAAFAASELPVASVTASSHDGNVPANTLDNNYTTRWSAQGNGQWIQYDLGQSASIERVKLAWHQGAQRQSTFNVQVSANGSSWNQVYAGTSSGTTAALEVYNFTTVTARYVRINGFGNNVNNWNSILETEIWGTVSSGGGGDTGGGGTGGLNPSLPPSGNFDLTKWKITLPDASEVQPSSLSNGYTHPSWFYTSSSNGGMVFRSPNLGSTTTNSTYTRSELREMLNPSAGTTSLGNNWVTSTSSSSTKSQAGGVDGTMNATLQVDRVSTTGDSTKMGRVVVGQIHGPDTEPIRLYYHKRPTDTKGAIYFGTDDLSNNNTWVNIIGGPSSLNPSNGIALGQKWSYEIKVVGLTMTVKVTPEGGSTTTVQYTLPSGYNNKYLYFKAGVYNQNNTGTSSDYVQATFHKLTHVHS
ncbi:polysaccharide lyase family 7 protein [Paenibacillus sp. SCIV0701]|uniref:Polysaccharide lyase family 7 protein n=2 Tax=Paenibacillus soyae TaxID=2969249 RepID=A0A9X2S6W6_9BACL|nr:polysaccharide lyase family 7 protein [Paenibacillus soyae]